MTTFRSRARACAVVTTLHDARCGCGGPAVLAMAGEQFYGGRCRRCGLILMVAPAALDELVRRVRAGLGRRPRRCWLRSIFHRLTSYLSSR